MLEEFKNIGEEMFALGLVDSHSGNLSVRQGDKILISSRGSRLGKIEEKQIVEVGLEQNPEGAEKDAAASRELLVHRAIYRESNALAIVHSHPPYAIALSFNESKLVPMDAEGQLYLHSIPVAWAKESIASEELARYMTPFFKSGNRAVIVRGHGAFTVGQTLEEAYQYTTCLESSCKIIYLAKLLTMRPPAMRPSEPRMERKRAIPPSIGVMDRARNFRRGMR